MTNIFGLTNPDEYMCHILGYMKSHSILEIKIENEGQDETSNTLYLTFEGVEYFDGPMEWKGANFSVTPPEVCLRFLRLFGKYDNIPDDYLVEKFKLFSNHIETSESLNYEIKILAFNGGISDSPSPFFLEHTEGGYQ